VDRGRGGSGRRWPVLGRQNEQLIGVAPSVLGVILGAIALFFTAAPVLLTFSAYLQNLVTGFSSSSRPRFHQVALRDRLCA
jgi:hypothetical protein